MLPGLMRDAPEDKRADGDAGNTGCEHDAERSPHDLAAPDLHRHDDELDGSGVGQRRADRGLDDWNVEKEDEQRRR